MPTEFLMPKLGLTMEEGTIVDWLVPDGDEVAAGTPVMLIETDKVETEVEAVAGGRLHRAAEAGQTFPCGAVIAWILAEGEDPPSALSPPAGSTSVSSAAAASPAASGAAGGGAAGTAGTASAANGVDATSGANGRRFVSPNARRVAATLGVDLARVVGTGPGGRVVSEDVEDAAARGDTQPASSSSTGASSTGEPAPPAASSQAHPRPASAGGASYPATAAARQLADLLGVDLAEVEVDPVERYVTRESVARYVRERLRPPAAPAQAPGTAAAPAPAPTPPGSPPPLLQTPTEVRRMSGMRGTIAKRMHASLQEMAQLTLTMDADVDAVVADRERRKVDGATPGFTDYVIAAAARALREHPAVNAQITGEGIALLPAIHVGVAVALDHGLVVPVVRNADQLRLADLSAETSRLAAAARGGTLSMADLEGGTFSVSALGMFGVDAFTPVINPPNAAILGVGRIRDDVVLIDGAASIVKRLTLSLTWDHRVLDGAPAAAFCQTIARMLGEPSGLD